MVGETDKKGVRRKNKAQRIYGDVWNVLGLEFSICLSNLLFILLCLALCPKGGGKLFLNCISKVLCFLSSGFLLSRSWNSDAPAEPFVCMFVRGGAGGGRREKAGGGEGKWSQGAHSPCWTSNWLNISTSGHSSSLGGGSFSMASFLGSDTCSFLSLSQIHRY